MDSTTFLSVLTTLLFLTHASPQPFLGINYGDVADNLPSPTATAGLLQSTTISKLRLYNANPSVLRSLSGTNISVTVTVANSDIASLAASPSAASAWLSANVLPFLPDTVIGTVSVGNEVLLNNDAALAAQLLPAMRNLQAALASESLDVGDVKVSTVHPMSVLGRSDPPSAGAFGEAYVETLRPVLEFLKETGGPFMVNPYPFFAYKADPTPETLAFCLFQPNSGRVDGNTNIKYTNMFDAQVDAVRSALNKLGFEDVEIVVAETGWPYNGDPDEVGATVENAKAYNGNLVSHLRSMVGTPLMPGKTVDTYIFALYDEDLKPGPASERSFGLYRPSDLSITYDVGLAKSSQSGPSSASIPTKPETMWCVPKVGVSDQQLQANLDYACGQPGVDCGPIQPGGACFLPNTVASHAAYAMNMLYQSSDKQLWNCDFSQTAQISSQNPSYDTCIYPGS